jgi:hypothetical protein
MGVQQMMTEEGFVLSMFGVLGTAALTDKRFTLPGADKTPGLCHPGRDRSGRRLGLFPVKF